MGNVIVKDNALIEASHRLSEIEQRLILLAILKARENCNGVEELKGKELIIYANDYANIYSINIQMAYKALKHAVVGLFEAKWGYKYVNDKGNKVVRYERFTQSAQYIEGEGSVSFKFADTIIPMLVELERRFTVYEIEQVAQLSSQYAMRLYEFCIQHLNKNMDEGWLDIALDELRFRFGLLPTEYKAMSDFKRRVLDYSLNEINEKTDLTASYTQKKQGRIIVGFKFEFKRKNRKAKTVSSDEPATNKRQIDLFEGLGGQEREMIQKRIDEHIKRIEEKGEIVSDFHRSNITKKAVGERWGVDVLEKKQKKKQLADDRKALEKAWHNVSNGTHFRHKKDGSIWRKDSGCLIDGQNRFVPEGMIADVFQMLEEIKETY